MSTFLKYGTGAVCGWEAAAIFTGKLPTVSRMVGIHPALGVLILGALTAHFYQPLIRKGTP